MSVDLELVPKTKRPPGQPCCEPVVYPEVERHIERMPIGDASVDVVISNCVINLSGDKRQVLCEAARVLRPGGRLAVSDVIADGDMDAATQRT